MAVRLTATPTQYLPTKTSPVEKKEPPSPSRKGLIGHLLTSELITVPMDIHSLTELSEQGW